MNRFIEKNGVDEDEWNMVFVDCLDNYYDEVSEAPWEYDSDPDSPFINKTPEECHQLLVKLREDTESEIITDFFVIMDERSAQDNTVLLASAVRDLEYEVQGVPTVRATFKTSALALILYCTGHSSVDEDRERAEKERDGVYRGIWSKIK